MSKLIKLFVRDERGVTAIEYGLIAGVLALGIMGTVSALSTNLQAVFTSISTQLVAAK